MHGQAFGRELGAKTSGEVAIELHHLQMRELFQQRSSQGREAGADLDQGVGGLGADGRDDALDDLAIVQEVLSETLACLVRGEGVGHHGVCRAICRVIAFLLAISVAASMATIRLPGWA